MNNGWDDELLIRQEALKCRVCKGTNPYICKCARNAWMKQYKTLDEYRNQWESQKGLIYSPSMKTCPTCVPQQSESLCECAKQIWVERRMKTI
jgi:hypothetical protein